MPGSLTIGVVLDLPEPHATVVERWRTRSGDVQAGRIAPHVTLIPPTRIEVAQADSVVAHLEVVAAKTATFTLNLAGTDSFRPVSQVAFVRVADGAQGAAQCVALEESLRAGPLGAPREYPFRPHVTVAHDVDDAALNEVCEGLSDFVARFVVARFSLYVHDAPTASSGARWTFERHFPFGG